MAQHQKRRKAAQVAAEVAGRTLGHVAHTIDSFQAQHPHPVTEMQEAVATGVEKLATAAAEARATTAATVKTTKAAMRRAQQMATRAGRGAKTVVKRVKKAVRRPPKMASITASPVTHAPATRKGSQSSLRSRPVPRATPTSSAKRQASAPPGTGVRTLQSAHVKRRQAHVSSQTKRQQARRDRKG